MTHAGGTASGERDRRLFEALDEGAQVVYSGFTSDETSLLRLFFYNDYREIVNKAVKSSSHPPRFGNRQKVQGSERIH